MVRSPQGFKQSRFIALLDDFDRTVELMDIAAESEGKADEQFAKYADTMEYKLNQLSTEWEKFKTGIIEEDLFKNSIESLTGFVKRLNDLNGSGTQKLVETFANFSVAIASAVRSIGIFKETWKTTAASIQAAKPVIIQGINGDAERGVVSGLTKQFGYSEKLKDKIKEINALKEKQKSIQAVISKQGQNLLNLEDKRYKLAGRISDSYSSNLQVLKQTVAALEPQKVNKATQSGVWNIGADQYKDMNSFIGQAQQELGTTEKNNEVIQRATQLYREHLQVLIQVTEAKDRCSNSINNHSKRLEENSIAQQKLNQDQELYRQQLEKNQIAIQKTASMTKTLTTGLSLVSSGLTSTMTYLPMVVMGAMDLQSAVKMAGMQFITLASSQGIAKVSTQVLAAAQTAQKVITLQQAVATEKLTVDQIKLRATELGLKDAQIAQTISTQGQIVANGQLTASFTEVMIAEMGALAPALAIVAALAAVAAAAYGIYKLSEYYSDAEISARKLRNEQERLEDIQKRLNETQADAKSKQEEYKKAKDLKEEYAKISAIKNKTIEEQEKEKELVSQINEQMPEIVLAYDEAANKIAYQNELWDSIIEKQKESAALAGKGYATSVLEEGMQEYAVLDAQLEYDKSKAHDVYHKYLFNGFGTFFGTRSLEKDVINKLDQEVVDAIVEYTGYQIDQLSSEQLYKIFEEEDENFWGYYASRVYSDEQKEIEERTAGLLASSFSYMGEEISDTEKQLIARLVPKTRQEQQDFINQYANSNIFGGIGHIYEASYQDLKDNRNTAKVLESLNITEEDWNTGVFKNLSDSFAKSVEGRTPSDSRYAIAETILLGSALSNFVDEKLELLNSLNDRQLSFLEDLSMGDIELNEKQINEQIENLFQGKKGITSELYNKIVEFKDDILKNIDTQELDKYGIQKNNLTLKQQGDLNSAISNFWSKAGPDVLESDQKNFVDNIKNYGFNAKELTQIFSSISIEKYNPLDKDAFIEGIRDSLKEGLENNPSVDKFVDDLSTDISKGTYENIFASKDADTAQIQEYGERAAAINKIFADNAKDLGDLLNSNKNFVAITEDQYKSLNNFEEALIEAGVDGADQILSYNEELNDFVFDVNKANEIRNQYGEKAIEQLKQQREYDKQQLDDAKNKVLRYEGLISNGKALNKYQRERLEAAREEVDEKTAEIAAADKLIDKNEELFELSKRIADNFNTATGRLSAMSTLTSSITGALSSFSKSSYLGQSAVQSLQEGLRPFGINANNFLNDNLALTNPEQLYKTGLDELIKSYNSGLFADESERIQAKALIADYYNAWMDHLEDVKDEEEKQKETKEKALDDIEKAEKSLADAQEKAVENQEKALEDIKKAEEDLVKIQEEYTEQLEVIDEKQQVINDEIEKYNDLLYGENNRKGKLDSLYNYEQAISSLSDTLTKTTDQLGKSDDINESIQALTRYTQATHNLIATEKAKQMQVQAGLSTYSNMIENGSATYTNRETGEQVNINFGQYARKDAATGKYILDQRLLNQAQFNDDYKNLIEENIETYNNYIDEYNKLGDEIEKSEQELQEKRKAAAKSYSEIEKNIADQLKGQYEEEVNNLKDKYSAMKTADDDYLSALEEALNKQRELRDRESQYEDLAEQEKRLSLLQRDTSGTRQLDVNKLKKDVEKTRKQLLDEAVNDVVDGLKKLAKENEETRQVELQLRDAIISNTAHWNNEAEAITSDFNSASDYASYMASINPDFADMTMAQQEIQIEEYKQQFSEALEYQSWNLLDATSSSGDAIVDTIDVATDEILKIATDKTTSFSDQVINSFNEISIKVEEDLKSQEDAIDNARDTLQEAVEKLDEISQKAIEAEEKIQDLNEAMVKQQQEDQEAIVNARDALSEARAAYSDAIAEMYKDASRATGVQGIFNQLDETAATENTTKKPSQLGLNDTYSGDQIKTLGTYKDAVDRLNNLIADEAASTRFFAGAPNVKSDERVNEIKSGIDELVVLLGLNSIGNYKEKYKDIGQRLGYTVNLNRLEAYATGGLVDYTGPAWVDGTKTAPEAFLSAADTRAIGNAARILSELQIVKDYDALGQIINNTVGDTSIEINLNIENLSSDIDIDNMIARVKDEIVSVANPIGINTILRQA